MVSKPRVSSVVEYQFPRSFSPPVEFPWSIATTAPTSSSSVEASATASTSDSSCRSQHHSLSPVTSLAAATAEQVDLG